MKKRDGEKDEWEDDKESERRWRERMINNDAMIEIVRVSIEVINRMIGSVQYWSSSLLTIHHLLILPSPFSLLSSLILSTSLYHPIISFIHSIILFIINECVSKFLIGITSFFHLFLTHPTSTFHPLFSLFWPFLLYVFKSTVLFITVYVYHCIQHT